MLKIKYKEYYYYFFRELFILITNKTLFKKIISKYAANYPILTLLEKKLI